MIAFGLLMLHFGAYHGFKSGHTHWLSDWLMEHKRERTTQEVKGDAASAAVCLFHRWWRKREGDLISEWRREGERVLKILANPNIPTLFFPFLRLGFKTSSRLYCTPRSILPQYSVNIFSRYCNKSWLFSEALPGYFNFLTPCHSKVSSLILWQTAAIIFHKKSLLIFLFYFVSYCCHHNIFYDRNVTHSEFFCSLVLSTLFSLSPFSCTPRRTWSWSTLRRRSWRPRDASGSA